MKLGHHTTSHMRNKNLCLHLGQNVRNQEEGKNLHIFFARCRSLDGIEIMIFRNFHQMVRTQDQEVSQEYQLSS